MSDTQSVPEQPDNSDITAVSVDAEATETAITVPPRSNGLRTALIAAAVVVALALGVGAFAAYKMVFTSDAHPEKAIPGSALAYVSLDLDPGLGQQAKLIGVARKFPKIKDAGDPAKWFKNFFDEADLKDVDAKTTIEPWLGLRAGIALWIHDKQPYGVIAAESRDDDAARTGLAKIEGVAKNGTFGYRVQDGVALIAFGEHKAQEAADAAAAEAATNSLDANPAYSANRSWLPGDEVLVGWANLDGIADAISELLPEEMAGLMSGQITQLKGTAVFGVRADDTGLEFKARSFGGGQNTAATKDPLTTVGTLPANTIVGAALGVPDIAEGAGGSLGLLGGLTGLGATPGLTNPTIGDPDVAEDDDLRAFMKIQEGIVNGLSNSLLTIAISNVTGSVPGIFAEVTAENAAAADALMGVATELEKLAGVKVVRDGTKVTVTTGTYQAQSGTLSGDALFTAATAGAPDGRTAAAFINVTALKPPAEISAVKAVGIVSGLEQGDGVTTIRVVIQ